MSDVGLTWRLRAASLTAVFALGSATLLAAPEQPERQDCGTSCQRLSPELVAKKIGKKWRGHPGRRVIKYRVHRGDTATIIATRFHAWTDELIAINHKRAGSAWYVGERVRVPVVVRAARAHGHKVGAKHHGRKHSRPTQHAHKHKSKHHKRKHHHARKPLPDPSRATVHRVIVRTAKRHHVRPNLALAIAWQESGWQQNVRSSVGAVGAMQIMPDTGRWMSWHAGRRLHIRHLHDNVLAGVLLIKWLNKQTTTKRSIAAYYQGLGAVRQYGFYRSTKHYVANVKHHFRALRRGWSPLG